MTKAQQIKYPGVLNQPIIKPTSLLLTPEQADAYVSDALTERLAELHRFYGIDAPWPKSAPMLALKLAMAHVRGFKIVSSPAKSGAALKWGGSRGLELLADVIALMRRNMTGPAACHHLTTNPEFAGRYSGETGKSLYRRYQDAKKLKRGLVQDLISRLQAEGAPVEDWLVENYALKKESGRIVRKKSKDGQKKGMRD